MSCAVKRYNKCRVYERKLLASILPGLVAQSSGILYPYLSTANDVYITTKNKQYFYCYAFFMKSIQKKHKNDNDFDFCFWATPFYISEFNSINCNDLKAVLFNSFSTFTLKIAQINQKHLQSKIIPNKSIKNCAQTQKITYNFREKFVVVLPQHHSNIFLQSLIFSHATFLIFYFKLKL